MRDSKPGDNASLDELLGIHVSDICQRFGFDPFSEIISADEQISLVPCCFRKWPYDIQAPLSKRPRAGQWIEYPPWLMYIWRKPLALVALLHVFVRLFLHVWPQAILDYGSMG